jgi:hypothetical protein
VCKTSDRFTVPRRRKRKGKMKRRRRESRDEQRSG